MKSAMSKNKSSERATLAIRQCIATSVVSAIFVALLLSTALGAEPPAKQEKTAPEPTATIPEDEFGRGSPRSSVKGYLAACREGDYQKASNYLDLRRHTRHRRFDGHCVGRN